MAYKYIKAKSISYGAKRNRKDIKYIVIHYTGNDSRTDTAKAECHYFANGNTRSAGAHFFVSQNGDVMKSIPMNRIAWAVGGFVTNKNGGAKYYQKCTNSNSVSIELCDNASRDPSPEQIAAVKKLIKYIRKYCPNAQKTVRHFDCSGKSCPARMTDETPEKTKRWIDFLEAIGERKPYPTVDLKFGDTGEQVKRLQRCLNKIDKAGLRVDGSFGPATRKAVNAFKKKRGLNATSGKVGPKTRAKIREELGKVKR